MSMSRKAKRRKAGPELSIARALSHFSGEDEARLCAFLDTMESAFQLGDVAGWRVTRGPNGFVAEAISGLDGAEMCGHGATFSEAVQAFSETMIAEGMKGAPEA